MMMDASHKYTQHTKAKHSKACMAAVYMVTFTHTSWDACMCTKWLLLGRRREDPPGVGLDDGLGT